MNNQRIIFFDGVCRLCNGWVDFVIKRDKTMRFTFVALQSEKAAALLPSKHFSPGQISTIIFLENGKLYKKSEAALRIFKGLPMPWKMLFVFIVVPAFIRNGVYDQVVKYRYTWFGKNPTCRLPTKEEESRFL